MASSQQAAARTYGPEQSLDPYNGIFSPRTSMTPEAPTPSLTEALRSTEERLAAARRRLDSAMIAGEVGTFEWDIVADRLYGDANFERLFDLALDASGAAPLA